MAAPPQTNGASANKSVEAVLDEVSSQAPPGTVLPPKHIRGQMETIAGYVARNGPSFEERLRNDPSRASKMSFLFPEDPYHAYYQWRLSEIKAGRSTTVSSGRKEGEVASGGTGAGFQGREERKGPEKPEDFAFSARMPNISAQDLEVVKLTALFVAKNGRSWMTALSQKEAGNFQFDFLRPQHSLYSFFSRLVDQYTELITGDSVDGGRPQKKRIVDLEANVADRFRILERAKKRAEWVKYQEAQKVQQEEAEEKEKVAYAQIDWHDFVVVETVVFDEDDEHRDLPAPTTLNDIQSLSLEQKGAISVGANMRLEEAVPDFDDMYNHTPSQPAPSRSPAVAQPQTPPPAQGYSATPPQHQNAYAPPLDTSDQNSYNTLQADRARARAAQEAARAQNPNAIKIRSNYVPAAQARSQQAKNTAGKSICPNCHQLIPNEEMEQHMRIEMLNPDWRDQYKVAQQRSSTTNLSTADVAANLKRLASQRSDVFDPRQGQQGGEEKRTRLDGGSQPQQMGAGGGAAGGGMPDQAGTGEGKDVQEQIRLIREKAKQGGG